MQRTTAIFLFNFKQCLFSIRGFQERPEGKKGSFLGKVTSLSQVDIAKTMLVVVTKMTMKILLKMIEMMTSVQLQVVSAKANEAKDKAEAFKAQRAQRHDRCFTLLVIDDQNTDWSKVPRFSQTLSIYQIYGIPQHSPTMPHRTVDFL